MVITVVVITVLMVMAVVVSVVVEVARQWLDLLARESLRLDRARHHQLKRFLREWW